VRAVVAHEVAHTTQGLIRTHDLQCRHRRIDYDSPHGESFQRIYALLRRGMVCPDLGACEVAIGGA